MNGSNKRLLLLSVVLICLLGALLYVRHAFFAPDFQVKYTTAENAVQNGLYRFASDVSLYHFSPQEGKMLVSTDFFSPQFLPNFPLQIGQWRGEDVAHQYADVSLFRLYHHPKRNDYIWLMIVYGGHPSQFHAAEVCYMVDGWDVAYRDIKKVKIADEAFPIRYLIAQKDNHIHLSAYWYVWPTPARRISDGTLLFRLSVEAKESEARAEAALKDFLNGLVNVVPVGVPVGVPAGATAGTAQKTAAVSPPPDVAQKPPLAGTPQDVLKEAKQRGLAWILSQRVPNRVVPYPHIDRRYLLLSFELDAENPRTENDRNYRYLFSRSAIYDDAIGLIALSMAGRWREAEDIIDAFERIGRSSGDLWFSYNTHDDWPSESNHEEAIIRNGASSWAGYAITYHIRRRQLEAPDILVKDKNYLRYLNLARRIADAILKDQVLASADPRMGAVTGGEGSYEMVFRQGRVVEAYHKEKVSWVSVEHNLDLYFFLRNLDRLTGEKKYGTAAQRIKTALLRAWNEKEGQFNRGLRPDGLDTMMALDCASWGLMFALALGDEQKINALFDAMERYEVTDPIHKIKGYRPYYKGLVYDEPSINKLFYPHKPDKSWADIQMVWSEGSLGVAMAYLKAGMETEARKILTDVMKMQTANGGIQYATREIPFQFSPSPSMAGTAWFAMVLFALDEPRLRDLFWD